MRRNAGADHDIHSFIFRIIHRAIMHIHLYAQGVAGIVGNIASGRVRAALGHVPNH